MRLRFLYCNGNWAFFLLSWMVNPMKHNDYNALFKFFTFSHLSIESLVLYYLIVS